MNRICGEVEPIARDLHSVEDEVPHQQSGLFAHRDECSRLQTPLARLRRDELPPNGSVRDAQHPMRPAEDELDDERCKPELDHNRLRDLARFVSAKRGATRNDPENQLRRAQQDVRGAESSIQSKDENIVTVVQWLEELRIPISRLGRDRDNARDRRAEAQCNVGRARGEVALTSS